ncbi:PREDICTED: uncharacterized protein LOC108568984 [Nicrophorus vespilloides]|uniref:Uncharacterized protein LOC108568984 n=1 Tax=Nicrophorus vespilloides TaxID=110193 RepID=A0ABM1NG80_NICVS|nr:PREDICTED: uncharacterized protein LOC108568984 [Nicrophorus vespilloides]
MVQVVYKLGKTTPKTSFLQQHPRTTPAKNLQTQIKMAAKFIFAFAFLFLALTKASPVYTPESKPDEASSTTAVYVPHATFPKSDTYPENSYDGYLVPVENYEEPGFLETFVPKTKMATNIALGLITKIAFYSMGAFATLSTLAIGFSILCTFTSVCFNFQMWWAGFGRSNGMRSLLSSDNLDAAEDAVNKALTKFKRFQRAVTSDY